MLSCTLTNTEWTVTDCVWSFNDEGQHVVRAVDHPSCTLEVSSCRCLAPIGLTVNYRYNMQ